jgi:hypothetical protein
VSHLYTLHPAATVGYFRWHRKGKGVYEADSANASLILLVDTHHSEWTEIWHNGQCSYCLSTRQEAGNGGRVPVWTKGITMNARKDEIDTMKQSVEKFDEKRRQIQIWKWQRGKRVKREFKHYGSKEWQVTFSSYHGFTLSRKREMVKERSKYVNIIRIITKEMEYRKRGRKNGRNIKKWGGRKWTEKVLLKAERNKS